MKLVRDFENIVVFSTAQHQIYEDWPPRTWENALPETFFNDKYSFSEIGAGLRKMAPRRELIFLQHFHINVHSGREREIGE